MRIGPSPFQGGLLSVRCTPVFGRPSQVTSVESYGRRTGPAVR